MSDSGRVIACLTGGGVAMIMSDTVSEELVVWETGELLSCVTGSRETILMLFSESEGSGSSTSEVSGDKGPTGTRSGTVSRVGLNGIFLKMQKTVASSKCNLTVHWMSLSILIFSFSVFSF